MWASGAPLGLCEKHTCKCAWETVTSARPLKHGESQETREEEDTVRVRTLGAQISAQSQGGRTGPLGEQSITEQAVASTGEK